MLVRCVLSFTVSNGFDAKGLLILTQSRSMSNNIGILLLCEVAAKPFYEQTNANYNAAEECKRNGKLSVTKCP